MSYTARNDLVLKLKEIFRSNRSDLDFGIYKILKHRRDEINQFIENDLIKNTEKEFGALTKVEYEREEAELENLRLEINRDFGEGTITELGEVTQNHESPKIKKYMENRSALKDNSRFQLEINDIFNHIYEFFNRYYDNGDFISQRRFGRREKYIIPHNGEEVSLYWANQDQYYVKTAEDYSKYAFNLCGIKGEFKILSSDAPQNNVKRGETYFLTHSEMPLRFNKSQQTIEIFFERRQLNEEDYSIYNIDKKSQNKTKLEKILEKNLELIITYLKPIESEINATTDFESLSKHLKNYTTKNSMDYFIHKNLELFLKREL